MPARQDGAAAFGAAQAEFPHIDFPVHPVSAAYAAPAQEPPWTTAPDEWPCGQNHPSTAQRKPPWDVVLSGVFDVRAATR